MVGFWVVMGVLVVAAGFLVYIAFRNNKVFKFKMHLIDLIDVASKKDIEEGRNWEWRFRTLESVKYEDMVWEFWKPIKPESWWENTSFLR